jgi:ribonuclease HIII
VIPFTRENVEKVKVVTAARSNADVTLDIGSDESGEGSSFAAASVTNSL